jgi:membrane protease YdiL (CAAX protease family)
MNSEPPIYTRDIIVSLMATLAVLIVVSVLVVSGLGAFSEKEPETAVLSAALLVVNPIALGACGLFFTGQTLQPLKKFLGFRRPKWVWLVPGVLLAGQLSDTVYRWIRSNVQGLDGGAVDNLSVAVQEPGLAGSFILLGALILAPLGEEVFFRGWIWGAVRHQRSAAVAVLASAFAFAAYHMDPAHALALLPLALWLSWLRWATGSIVPCILAHGLNNLLWVLGVHFWPEAGPLPISVTVLSMGGLLGMMMWVHKNRSVVA